MGQTEAAEYPGSKDTAGTSAPTAAVGLQQHPPMERGEKQEQQPHDSSSRNITSNTSSPPESPPPKGQLQILHHQE